MAIATCLNQSKELHLEVENFELWISFLSYPFMQFAISYMYQQIHLIARIEMPLQFMSIYLYSFVQTQTDKGWFYLVHWRSTFNQNFPRNHVKTDP